ncbi:MAG: GIY-YIG nuclease family protein [Spirochaetaceae bacterium]|nr:GIY-YIG nuclease family protein [Spirochaetaceae bacterium]
MLKKTWYVYILQCCDKTLYTGITIELKRRLEEHNSSDKKGARYTRTRRPVKLVYYEIAESRGEAMKRERAIKKMEKSSKIRLITRRSCTPKVCR